jgi:hypothetical protein
MRRPKHIDTNPSAYKPLRVALKFILRQAPSWLDSRHIKKKVLDGTAAA